MPIGYPPPGMFGAPPAAPVRAAPLFAPGTYRVHDSSRGLLEGVLVVIGNDASEAVVHVRWRYAGQRQVHVSNQDDLRAMGAIVPCGPPRRAA